MDKFIAFLLLLPLMIVLTFQGPLISNASVTEESIRIALYEGQKKAAEQGHYDEEIYNMIKESLVDNHHYKEEAIKVTGTETVTTRGEYMDVEIEVPKPKTSVLEIFKFGNDEPFRIKTSIMSEYSG